MFIETNFLITEAKKVLITDGNVMEGLFYVKTYMLNFTVKS